MESLSLIINTMKATLEGSKKPVPVTVVPEEEETRGPGVYSSVKPDPTTKKALVTWMEAAGIPNPVPADKLHSTIVYSKETFAGYVPRNAITVAKPAYYSEWGFYCGNNYSIRRIGPEKKAIALCFNSMELWDQFYQAMNLGASWDFEDKCLHITLSYDAPDFDFSNVELPTFELVFEPETVEPLQDDWAADNQLKILFPISKTNDEQRLVYGWASVIEKDGNMVVDHHDDIIEEADLVKAAHVFLSDYRGSGEMHVKYDVATIVESMVFTKELQKTLGIDLGKVGWLVAFKVNDDAVWKKVKSGEYQDFSIGGRASREEV